MLISPVDRTGYFIKNLEFLSFITYYACSTVEQMLLQTESEVSHFKYLQTLFVV